MTFSCLTDSLGTNVASLGKFDGVRDVFCKKHNKNGHLLEFVTQTYFCLFGLSINICTLFRSTLLYYSLSSCMYI